MIDKELEVFISHYSQFHMPENKQNNNMCLQALDQQFNIIVLIRFIAYNIYIYIIYYRFIVRFPIGLEFLFITFLLQEC